MRMSMNKIQNMMVTVIALIFLAYISYTLIQSLSDVTPGFGPSGWQIYGAIVAAILVAVAVVIKGRGSR